MTYIVCRVRNKVGFIILTRTIQSCHKNQLRKCYCLLVRFIGRQAHQTRADAATK